MGEARRRGTRAQRIAQAKPKPKPKPQEVKPESDFNPLTLITRLQAEVEKWKRHAADADQERDVAQEENGLLHNSNKEAAQTIELLREANELLQEMMKLEEPMTLVWEARRVAAHWRGNCHTSAERPPGWIFPWEKRDE